jgi:cytochrome b subunit of formate dehydrogenase/mono/diheme cytochrome c family protein
MSATSRTYVRFPLARRIEHLVMLVSFSTLGLTGLVQKYITADISRFIITLMGGIEMTRFIHHFAATLMMFGVMYHIIYAGYEIFVLHTRPSMLPNLQDAKDGLQAFMYNLGLAKSRPQMGRYTFEEKMEYWAFVWGAIVMGGTGFLMWNPITTVKYLPGEFIPAAKAAHGGEALLAVLAIIVWHFYGVHLKSFNKSMWTGQMTEEEMLHEHPLELADIKAGVAERPVDAATLRKRQLIYLPVALILMGVMLFGIFGFLNVEETALETLPPVANLPIYVPQTATPIPTLPPTATTAAPTALTYDAFAGPLFQNKCGACHGSAAMAGLNLTTYTDALKGSQNGAMIVAGDSANSKLVQVQSSGKHPGLFSAEELEQIKQWINAGAPEK